MSELYGDLEPWAREARHALKALENRPGPHQTVDTERFMQPILDQIQELEDMFWDVFYSRFLENATGDALDILGAIVGEERFDDTEASFKLRIRLKLRALNSTKRAIDFIELLLLLEGTTWTIQEGRGWVVIVQNGGDEIDAEALHRLLEITSADGVLVRLESNYGADDPFQWPSQDGSIPGTAWPSEDGTIEGGDWPGKIES